MSPTIRDVASKASVSFQLAAAVLGERLTLLGWTGIALVMACLACIVWPTQRAA